MNLLENVKNDIEKFLNYNQEFFFNERDFQMHLAIYLKLSKNNYDDVDVEYHVPIDFKKDFDKEYLTWDTKVLSIDIMVRKGEYFVPIELKYKLKGLKGSIERLGEKSQKEINIVTNQAAQDLGRYDFWKDVKRVELLSEFYKKVIGGLVVFLTNDSSYKNKPNEKVKYYNFRMDGADDIGNCVMQWNGTCPVSSNSYGDFLLKGSYRLSWKDFVISKEKHNISKNIKYHYCIAQIVNRYNDKCN